MAILGFAFVIATGILYIYVAKKRQRKLEECLCSVSLCCPCDNAYAATNDRRNEMIRANSIHRTTHTKGDETCMFEKLWIVAQILAAIAFLLWLSIVFNKDEEDEEKVSVTLQLSRKSSKFLSEMDESTVENMIQLAAANKQGQSRE